MPLILGANSLAGGGYQVDNSLRFNTASSDYLNRSAVTGDRRTFTISAWVKRSKLGSEQQIYSSRSSASNVLGLYFQGSNDTLLVTDYQSGGTMSFTTSAVYRDVSAWYHIVLAVDTTQATNTNRVKLYVNGEQVTFSASSYPTLDRDLYINVSGSNHYIGTEQSGRYFDGYMSDVYLIDGQALTPTDFGEFDADSGVWKPIVYEGTYGTNGFFLEFKDSSALGDDTSGNGNNFTVNNLTSIDQTTNTPTNNFATLNGILPYNTTMVLTEGNLKGKTPTDHQGKMQSFFSDFAMTQGKWYAEFKVDVEDTTMIGVSNNLNINQQGSTASAYNFIYQPYGYAYFSTGVVYYNSSGTSVPFGDSYTTGNIIGVALDLDNVKLYFSKNGVWQNSGDPTSGATGTGSTEAAGATALPAYNGNNPYFFAFCDFGSTNNTTVSANFGNPPFTIITGNADANGYGNFEYAVPTGYLSLCTKNLSEVNS
jgi:hypothetical protein